MPGEAVDTKLSSASVNNSALVSPTISTHPPATAVAVWCTRACSMVCGAAVNVPVPGLKNSAVAMGLLFWSCPPVISTRPSRSKVAVWSPRHCVISPVAVKVCAAGS